MGSGHALRLILLTALAAVVAAVSAAGCGDADADERRTGGVTEAFIDLVGEFNAAARTGEELEAIERSKDLEPKETKAFWAFCENLSDLKINSEEELFSEPDELIARIRKLAEYRFANKRSPTVAAALAHLRQETDLASFDVARNSRYIHACAAGEWPRWR